MRHVLYAVIAACLAMFATSGIVALATAAPKRPLPQPTAALDVELESFLDEMIDAQLAAIQYRLQRERTLALED